MFTIGVRWEFYPFGYSDNGKGLRYLNLNASTPIVQIGGYNGVPENDNISVGSGQWLPRAGLAYNVTPTTVVRLGYGQSADPNNWRYFRNAYPAVILDTNVPAVTTDFVPAASLTGLNATGLGGGSYTVPTGIVLSPLPNLNTTVLLPTNASTTTIPNPFRRGYVNSFNFTVQQQMWKNLVFQTGYAGARAIRPLTNMNANPSAPGTGSIGGLLSQQWGANFTGTINQLQPFKNNYYDSLQTRLTQRMAQGSSYGIAWTWSKAINYSENEDLSSLAFPYPLYWQKNRSLASFDRTHNFEAWGVLQMPFGAGQRWLTEGPGKWILGGWMVSPTISFMSGAPFTVGAGGNLAANGAGQTADLVGNFSLIKGKPLRTGQTCAQTNLSCHYFDAGVFAAPLINATSPAHFGNTRRNQFRGPGYFNMNLSLARDFKLYERLVMTVRADALGLTNTPHFNNPNVSCPSDATTPGPLGGSGQLCNTGTNNNFGVITSTASPGGFFGPDSGARNIWLAVTLRF